jgi:hypothetical protein
LQPYPVEPGQDRLGTAKVGGRKKRDTSMGRIIKALLLLVIFAFIGLVGFAYLADFTPAQDDVTKPVVLNAD